MPAGPPRSPGTLPRWLTRLRALPQGEVYRALLAIERVVAVLTHQVLDALVRQLAVIRLAADPVIHVATRRVGVAFVDQSLDHLDDRRDLLTHARLDVRRQHVEQ